MKNYYLVDIRETATTAISRLVQADNSAQAEQAVKKWYNLKELSYVSIKVLPTIVYYNALDGIY